MDAAPVSSETGSERDPRWTFGFEATRVEHFVSEKKIVANAGMNHAEHLAWCSTGKRTMTSTFLFGGEARTLMGFDVGP